ncbi:MASE1 domain-containing protein [Streptantibioticus ferralitis]|uniref:MASE1 domain-containing protein n=1 Tax=Streptantibioticus ferralitis TaxID=236510 RepID=UPI0033798F5F
MVRNEDIRRHAATAARILAVAAAYFVTGRLGLLQRVTIAGAVVTPLWPPTGIALTCLLLTGPRIWPGITLGTLLVTWSLGPMQPADVGIIVGNTLAPVCAFLMLRWVDFRVDLERLRDGAALVFLGALTGMLVSATLGTGSLVAAGSLPVSGFWPTWSAWWAGDAMGVLVFTPLLLVLRRARLPREIHGYRWVEAAALLVSTVAVTLLVTNTRMSLLFLIFPVLIWAALRFQLAGAAPCVLFMSVLAVVAATHQSGPFAHHGLFAVMVNLQALNGSAALTALLLAAVISEQKNTHRRIQQACEALAEVVARLAPGETTHRWPPSQDQGRSAP